MGMDFVALMKYGGPSASILCALTCLEADSPPEIKTLVPLFQERGFVLGDREATAWEYHHRPELHDSRVDRRPTLPNLSVALHLREDFFLTFGADAVEVYHLLRWRRFLKEPDLQQAMLAACARLAHLFEAMDCIITSDYNPVVHAFREGGGFDAALAAAGPEDGERAALADLLLEEPEDYAMREVKRPGGGTGMEYRDLNRDQAPPPGWERASTWDSKGYWRFPLRGGQGLQLDWNVALPQGRSRPTVILLDELQWQTSHDPRAMWETLLRQDSVSQRKLRLWACACVRRIWPRLVHANSRKAVEVAERFADGLTLQREMDHWVKATASARRGKRRANTAAELTARLGAAPSETSAFYASIAEFPPSEISDAAADCALEGSTRALEQQAQAELLRDIFGPTPLRPVAFEPSWRTATVLALAEAAYDDRDLPSGRLHPARLHVLADALLDAGGSEDICRHLREPGSHVRGCWVIDSLLSKT